MVNKVYPRRFRGNITVQEVISWAKEDRKNSVHIGNIDGYPVLGYHDHYLKRKMYAIMETEDPESRIIHGWDFLLGHMICQYMDRILLTEKRIVIFK